MTGPGCPQTMQTSQPPLITSVGRAMTIAVAPSAPTDAAGTVDKSIRACEPRSVTICKPDTRARYSAWRRAWSTRPSKPA